MRKLLRDKPWLLLVALAVGFLAVLVLFVVVAQRHKPKFIEVPPPAAKP